MKQTFKNELIRHRLLLISLTVSIILLVTFLVFQYYELKVLSLDIKWILLSGVPILVGLFIGGYIKSFKGFGLELESNLSEPISLTVVSKIDLAESPGMTKESLNRLQQLSDSDKNKINRIRFIIGKTNYYDIYAIEEHFRILRHIKFIEIINQDGKFLYLLPASKLKTPNNNIPPNPEIDYDRAQDLIRAIETEKIEKYFPDAVKDYILTTDNTIEAYRKIKKSNQTRTLFMSKDVLPIVNERMNMIGTVDLQKLESKIAEEVEKSID